MKVKLFLSIAVLATAILCFISCSDSIDSIGQGMMPNTDDMLLDIDTAYATAETISLNDAVYIQSPFSRLGHVEDPIFGYTKADFLTEFFTMETMSFHPKLTSIDSTIFSIFTEKLEFIGDENKPIGLSLYEVNKKKLKPNFLTNIDPEDYCDMSKPIGQRFFRLPDLMAKKQDTIKNNNGTIISLSKLIDVNIDPEYSKRIYKQWLDDSTVFSTPEKLREVFKGIYVTTTHGKEALMSVNNMFFYIHYSYMGRNYNDTKDSIRPGVFSLPITPEVLQLHRVKSSPIQDVVDYDKNEIKTYIKGAGALATRITIPLEAIAKKAKIKDGYKLNAAQFKFIGYTEHEKKLVLKERPRNLLFINEDSLKGYFLEKRFPNSTTSFILTRDAENNSYNFGYQNTSVPNNNLSELVRHYLTIDPTMKTVNYLLIPIDAEYTTDRNGTAYYNKVENTIHPYTAVLRTDKENLAIRLMFSRYNEQE